MIIGENMFESVYGKYSLKAEGFLCLWMMLVDRAENIHKRPY
jgi:hypothetical protein